MRIAFVLGSTPPRHTKETDVQAAVELKGDWLGDEAMAVASLGHEVSVHLIFNKDGDASHNNVDWFFRKPVLTGRKLRGGKEFSPRLLRSVKEWKPDLLHYQIISHAANYALFTHAARRWGVPVVGQHHGDPISPYIWNNWPLGWAARRSDAVVFLTKEHERIYREKFRLHGGNTHVIPVGYNEYFSIRDREAARRKTGVEGDPVLFWAAMLNKRKDPLTLLNAFGDLAEKFPGARLYMAGEGPIEEEVHRHVANSSLLASRVTMLGYVNNKDLPDYFNAADIYVMASHWEGFAISSLEAMACGLVPVLTRIPCFVEQTNDGELGLLFEPGNREELVKRLEQAIGEKEWREEVRRRLPEQVARFTWKASAEGLDRLYHTVIADRKKGMKR